MPYQCMCGYSAEEAGPCPICQVDLDEVCPVCDKAVGECSCRELT